MKAVSSKWVQAGAGTGQRNASASAKIAPVPHLNVKAVIGRTRILK